MKRFLSLIVAVVAVFMVGFTTVFAAEPAGKIVVEKSTTWYDGTYDNVHWAAYVKYAKDVNGSKRYAFCLESEENVVFDQLSINSDWKNAKANAIITKAYQLGFGTGHNNYGVNDVQFYGVVQSAIWNAVNGEGKNGYYGRYQQWIKGTNKNDNNYGKNYSKLFDELMSASNVSYSVKITGDTNMKKDGDFLVSGDLKVEATNVPSNAKFTITLSNIDGGKNGSAGIATNGSNWNHTQTVGNGETVKVRMPIVEGHQNYSVQLNVESSFEGEYVIYNYPTSKGQDIGVAIPSTSKVNADTKVTGSYIPKRTDKKNLTVKKTDMGGKELKDAKMEVYSFDDNKLVDSWTSDDKVDHIIKGLTVDKIYKLVETAAPAGYQKLVTNIYFKVVSSGNVVVCSTETIEKNGKCEEVSSAEKLTITNRPTKFTVSKISGVDQGELAGAHMQIKDSTGKIVKDINGIELDWDSDGNTRIIEGLVIGETYKMIETSSPVGFDAMAVFIYFQLDDNGKVQLCNVKNDDFKNAECGGTVFNDENGVTYAEIKGETLVIINYPSKESSVLVSKMDFTNGKELKGAKMKICTLAEYEKDGDSCKPSEDSWSWTSSDKPYKIALQPGEYVLFETLPVDGYESYMLIGEEQKEKTTAYKFSIVEGKQTKIDVYNELKAKKIDIPDVPSTGVTTGAYLIGGLVMLVGAGTVVIAKKKENM